MLLRFLTNFPKELNSNQYYLYSSLKLFLMKYCLLILLIALFPWGILLSQSLNDEKKEVRHENNALRVYLDCDDCDEQFFIENIRFVNFVRDPKVAQIHAIISSEQTAGNGHKFHIRLIGRENFEGDQLDLSYISIVGESDDKQRQGIARVLSMGLMPFVSQTLNSASLNFQYNESSDIPITSKFYDPWNFWVFRLDIGGTLAAEESRNGFAMEGGARADRITEQWRMAIDADFLYEEDNFKDEDEQINSVLREQDLDGIIVKSISEHWSTGFSGEIYSTTFRNIDLGLTIAPAVEYNFYPWKESSRQIMAIAYRVGIRSFEYIEETIYDKLQENLAFQSLSLKWELIQPWGKLDLWLEGSHYFEDFSANRILLSSDLSFRIKKGLTVFMETEFEGIHDQLYLPKSDASRDEILLQRRQLETTFIFSASFGLRYTFGSIYNYVVNRRLKGD